MTEDEWLRKKKSKLSVCECVLKVEVWEPEVYENWNKIWLALHLLLTALFTFSRLHTEHHLRLRQRRYMKNIRD